MTPIVVVFHGLFYLGTAQRLLNEAVQIITDQMRETAKCGLMEECAEMIVGLNGNSESLFLAKKIFPASARLVFHGLDSRNENSTILLVEKVARQYPEANVLYFHAKGSTHPAGSLKWRVSRAWRGCMMYHLVTNWRRCVADLEAGYESVGCHWMEPPETPETQYIWAGNFWWARASFLRTLPSMLFRQRIADSGLKSLESRFESEVWIGNGPRPPKHLDYHPGANPCKVDACPGPVPFRVDASKEA